MVNSLGNIAIKARIQGRVQGVFYRHWAEDKAAKLGLKGWVRNRLDGSVEAMFAGKANDVETMLTACHRGPPKAKVDAVDTSPTPDFKSHKFIVRSTR